MNPILAFFIKIIVLFLFLAPIVLYFDYFLFFIFNRKVKKLIPNYQIGRIMADPDLMFLYFFKMLHVLVTLKIFRKNSREELVDEALNLNEVKRINDPELNKDIQKIYSFYKWTFILLPFLFLIIVFAAFNIF